MKADPETEFYVISRSGRNKLTDKRIHNLRADVSLGPKSFVQGKADLVKFLQDSSVPLAYISPTLVYGNGRKDDMTRWLPLLKFFGIFSKKLKPVEVNNVADELVRKMLA